MKLILKKELSGLIPMSESYDDFNSIEQGAIVSCEVKSPRNIGLHRKFFAMLNIAYENRQDFEQMSFDNFRREIIARAGFYDMHVNFKGMPVYQAKSISFAKMKQEEFEEVYSRCIDVVLEYVLCDMKSEELKNAVNLVLGF